MRKYNPLAEKRMERFSARGLYFLTELETGSYQLLGGF